MREAGPCADYTPFIEGIARDIKFKLDRKVPEDQIKVSVRNLLITYKTTGIQRGTTHHKTGDAQAEDLLYNKVHMIRNKTGPVSYTFRVDIFSEIVKTSVMKTVA